VNWRLIHREVPLSAFKLYCGVEVLLCLFLILAWICVKGQVVDPAAFSQRKKPPRPIGRQTGWAPELVWRFWRTNSLVPLSEMKPRFLRQPSCCLVTVPNNINSVSASDCQEVTGHWRQMHNELRDLGCLFW